MAKPLVPSAGAPTANRGDDLPQPGDYDHVDPDDVEVVARGPALSAGRPFLLAITVPLEMDTLRAIVEAAHAEGMEAAEYVQQAVRRLGETLRDGTPIP